MPRKIKVELGKFISLVNLSAWHNHTARRLSLFGHLSAAL
jgi:hypothetical protein